MKRYLLAGALAGAFCTPAYASFVNWDFGQHAGLLGTSQGFSSSLFSLTARGFDAGDVGSNLFSKTAGGDETGLGLSNDPSGDNEISVRNGFVQLNLDGLLSKLHGFQFSMGSTTQGEGWIVFGSQDAHPFQFTSLIQSIGLNDEGVHNLPGGWDNYNFFYDGGFANAPPSDGGCQLGCDANVLLSTFAATTDVGGVPEPRTWAMLGIGFAVMAFMGFKRGRKGRLATIA